QAWLLFTPLACYPLIEKGQRAAYVILAFLLSVAYFSVRYEFATTFSLLWILPVLLAATRGAKIRPGVAIAAFFASCAGFAIAVSLHHVAVASENNISIREASA